MDELNSIEEDFGDMLEILDDEEYYDELLIWDEEDFKDVDD